MKHRGLVILLAAALPLLPAPTAAQTPEAAPTPPAAPPANEFEGPAASPRGAFLRSLVLPGWGQAYVGVPGRGVIYFSLASGSLWMSYLSRRQLLDARREQAWLRDSGQIEPTAETDLAITRSRHFEDWVALTIFLSFFSGADAYVAAYLADFDERVRIGPGDDRSLQIDVRIPLGLKR